MNDFQKQTLELLKYFDSMRDNVIANIEAAKSHHPGNVPRFEAFKLQIEAHMQDLIADLQLSSTLN